MPPHDRSPSPTRRVIDAAHDLVAAIWPDYRGDVAEAIAALAEVECEARRNGAPTGWLAFSRLNARRKLDGDQPNAAPEAQPRTAEDERRDVLAFIASKHAEHDLAARDFEASGNADAYGRCRVRSGALHTIAAYIERGDHEGAADRIRAVGVDGWIEASRRKCPHREDGDRSACDHCSLKG